jgi:hypothetical protein
MARYIDADKFLKRLNASCAFPDFGTDGLFLLGVVEDLLKMQPTADDAQRAEVAREILEEIKRIGCCSDGIRLNFWELSDIEKKYTEEGK